MYMKSQDNDMIVRLSDKAWIPLNPANSDYAAYLQWLAAGNEPLEYDAALLT